MAGRIKACSWPFCSATPISTQLCHFLPWFKGNSLLLLLTMPAEWFPSDRLALESDTFRQLPSQRKALLQVISESVQQMCPHGQAISSLSAIVHTILPLSLLNRCFCWGQLNALQSISNLRTNTREGMVCLWFKYAAARHLPNTSPISKNL